MTEAEKYYRGSYELLDLLEKKIKDGYDEINYTNFFHEVRMFGDYKIYQNIHYLQTTMCIALLGLNREKIEKAGKHTKYNNEGVFIDARTDQRFKKIFPKELTEFENKKTINTGLDSWISIEHTLETNPTNEKLLELVRNSLLHGLYVPKVKEVLQFDFFNNQINKNIFSTIQIKNKSFFLAELLNINFFQFVFSYFGNKQSSMSDKLVLFLSNNNIKINDLKSLRDYLADLVAIEIDYNMETDYDGKNTLEAKIFAEICDAFENGRKERTINTINQIVNQELINKTISDVKANGYLLDVETMNFILKHIQNVYGDDFYNLEENEKLKIISGLRAYSMENPKVLSNQIVALYYLINNCFIGNLDLSFIDDSAYEKFATYPALLILRAYLILYRLQYNDFEQVDYDKVDIDYNNIIFNNKKIDGSISNDNYFMNDLKKLKGKNKDKDDYYLMNQAICNTFRNAFAHGNIETQITVEDNGDLRHIIVVKDIYKGKIKEMIMDLETFEKFVHSEAFNPNYLILEKEKVKTLI